MKSSAAFAKVTGNGLRNLASNLLGGLKSAFFLPVRPETFRVTWSQLVGLIILTLAPPFVADFWAVGLKGTFFLSGLPGALFLIPFAFIAASALAYLARQSHQVLLLTIAFLSLGFAVDVAAYLLYLALKHTGEPRWTGWGYFSYYVPYAWLALAAGLASIRLLSLRPQFRSAAFVLAALFLASPLALVWRDRTLWAKPYDEESSAGNKYQALAGEEAFYLQPKLLERELAAVQPGREGIVDLYFVGVAAYSSQDVFMREVHSVSKLFNERFDTQGRTVTLINNAKTATEAPFASATSLSATLKLIGEAMNRDEDIVFMFLTSHGSKERGLSLDAWPFRFKDLEPKQLRKMLDDSGIKRRVIVVSACHSGVFVEPLKDENTLVITAAAADKKSFGCSNEAEYTYFGKAYFDEALRATYSFTEAFKIANPRIAAREKEEGFDSSDPMIFVGKDIEPVLAILEDRLKRRLSGDIRQAGVAPQPEAPKD